LYELIEDVYTITGTSEYGIVIYEMLDESGEYFSTWMPDLEDWQANAELIQGPPRTSI